jgi:basic amino acid/polyamine antiporter, APA family
MAEQSGERGLVRAIGTWGLAAGIVNVTVGGGIFRLPAGVAAAVGPAAPLAYLACTVAMGLIVLCFAQAGSRVAMTGGPYAYIETAFGPFVGFVSGALLWVCITLALSAVSTFFADSLLALVPALGATGRRVALVVVIAVLAGANMRGVGGVTRFNALATVAKLLPLILLVLVGLVAMRWSNLAWHGAPSAGSVSRASVLLIFAFLGIESALVPSGEVRDPARTVPRALFLALATTTTLYLLIQRVAQGLLGPAIADFASAPLAEAASRVLGSGGRLLVIGGAIVSMFGYVAGDMLGSPRSLYALGRDGILPAALARVHPRFHTPHVAIVVYAMLIAALAVSSSFTQLAILANVAALTLYLTCVAASYELQRRDVRADGAPFRLPGGPAIPVLAAAVIVWLLSNATARELAVEALVVAVASLFYYIRRTQPVAN